MKTESVQPSGKCAVEYCDQPAVVKGIAFEMIGTQLYSNNAVTIYVCEKHGNEILYSQKGINWRARL